MKTHKYILSIIMLLGMVLFISCGGDDSGDGDGGTTPGPNVDLLKAAVEKIAGTWDAKVVRRGSDDAEESWKGISLAISAHTNGIKYTTSGGDDPTAAVVWPGTGCLHVKSISTDTTEVTLEKRTRNGDCTTQDDRFSEGKIKILRLDSVEVTFTISEAAATFDDGRTAGVPKGTWTFGMKKRP